MTSAGQHVLLMSDTREQGQAVADILASVFSLEHVALHGNLAGFSVPPVPVVVYSDLREPATVHRLKRLLHSSDLALHQRVFIVNCESRVCAIQAEALGATACLYDPVDPTELLRLLLPAREDIAHSHGQGSVDAVIDGGSEALRDLFSGLVLGENVPLAQVAAHGADIAEAMGEAGIGTFLERVRAYHHGTYQHCLAVTGIAVAFGQHLRMSAADINRLSVAGLVHDVGKARVPLTILDKPGHLSDKEFGVIKSHPVYGFDYLTNLQDVDTDMLHAVRWHHEYLDGSGYPDGISGSEVPDIVRVMTIADIFGALTERRAYKQVIAPETAFDMLVAMGEKLDQPLVRAFREVALAAA